MIEGTVLGGTNNAFDVEDATGHVRSCIIKGKVLKGVEGYYNPLAPGDRVLIDPDDLDIYRGRIVSLVTRKNHFVRLNQKGNSPQLLAANLDLLVIVTTPDEPPFRPRFVDRALIQADAEHIPVIILLNKADLEVDPDVYERISDWERIGYRVVEVSAKTGEGVSDFAQLLVGKLTAFVGQSGVGKSSIINALSSRLNLKTGEISYKYGKGSHTTTKGTLFHVHADNGTGQMDIIDTPGVRRFVLHDIPAEDLALYFPEMEPIVGTCTWGASCTHTHEPGCKILEAVHAGVIHEQRYESWQRIKDEIETGSPAD